jgi:hypothetical protein
MKPHPDLLLKEKATNAQPREIDKTERIVEYLIMPVLLSGK